MTDETIEAKTVEPPRVENTASESRETFQFPKFEVPNFGVPDGFREVAAQWVDQNRKNFDAVIEAAGEAYGAYESSWSSAAKGMADYTAKLTDAVHKNADAAFTLAQDLLAAKSLPDFVAISTSGVRRQFETLATQNQEFWSLAQAAAVGTIRPLHAAIPKAFQPPQAS